MAISAPSQDSVQHRRALVETGVCQSIHPAVTLELYGNLRLKTGRDVLPMRAESIATALAVLKRVCPQAERLLPQGAALAEHFRFSINGRVVTTDITTALQEGDHVILFSASVGG